MAVKGKQKEQKEFTKELFVGFAPVKVVAVNPSRDEINKLVGREASEDDKETNYIGNDAEGNTRLRLAFWLKDLNTGKFFVDSFNITDKERKTKDGNKVQIINSVCTTSWAPYIKDGDENPTSKVDESLIPNWFLNFTNKEGEILGSKKWRKALSGEEELGTLIRSWLGRLNFNDPDTEALVDMKKLFKENLKELKDLISLNDEGDFLPEGLDTPFVALLGVRTDETDSNKKYQQVCSKAYLPFDFMKYINNGLKFPSDYTKKIWRKFKDEVEGDYGFDAYFELVPMKEYDPTQDISGGKETAKEVPEPQSSDY